MALSPVQDRARVHFEGPRSLDLAQLALEVPKLEVLTKGPGLKIGCLWFLCIESDGHELQKSNASLDLRPPRKLQSNGKFAA